MKKMIRTRRKGLVLRYGRKWLRRISERHGFNDIKPVYGHCGGLYVLYKGKNVVYIGKARTNLAKRLRDHTADHLKNKWDAYSWFITRPKYISDCEALLHRMFYDITNITINDVKARFTGLHHSIKQNKKSRRK